MKNLRVAVIGLGNMGKHHARNYFEIPNADLVAVCDANQTRANQFADQFKCKAYTSLESLLEGEDLDAINILFEASGILLLSIAAYIMSMKEKNSLSKLKTREKENQ